MKDPIVQATNRHHAEEADYQRRAEALTEEIYANLPAHLDEIVEFTDGIDAFRMVLNAYLLPHQKGVLVGYPGNVVITINALIGRAVKKIVERRLE